ncbi:MAG: hypothetical protein GXO54_03910 [Chloroflexi bacterium]|nr:hypothetical protein [Chloroflexota bacterium]
MRVVLFDLDGVLVRPRGYRAAVRATFAHFAHRWGLEPPEPREADLALFEAHGITSEWDMVPLLLAALWHAARGQGLALPPSLPDPAAEPVPPPARVAVSSIDIGPWIEPLTTSLSPGAIPSQEAWALHQKGYIPFAHLPTPLARALFAETREVRHAPITRVFQHYTLGSATFTRTYGLPAAFETPSFLLREDLPRPPAAWRRAVRQAHARGACRVAVMTARPSQPEGAGLNAAPEANLALELLEWDGVVPIVGLGDLAQFGPGEVWLKPHPAHALLALARALGLAPEEAHRWTRALLAHTSPPRLWPAGQLALAVVEDTPPGLRAAQAARAVLQRAYNEPVALLALGLSADSHKARALARTGARVYPSWPEVQAALTAWGCLA